MTGPTRQPSPTRRPLARPSLREFALEEIRLAITTGQLDEGRTYSAAGLAKQLGISLSPVREAMMSLVSEGTVEAIPNRGFRLRPISLTDLDEIIRIRVVLAMPAVTALAGRAADGDHEVADQLAELRRLADSAVRAVDADAYAEFFRADRDFHRLLVAYGLGDRAAEISIRLRDQSRITGLGPAFVADRQTADELVEIVGHLAAGRAGDAREAVTRNLYCYRRMLGVEDGQPIDFQRGRAGEWE